MAQQTAGPQFVPESLSLGQPRYSGWDWGSQRGEVDGLSTWGSPVSLLSVFVCVCLTEITLSPDLVIMKIEKREKQVCVPLTFSHLSCRGLGTLSCV